MTEPRFHAAVIPERPGSWCVLDNQYPGVIRAKFPLLPADTFVGEELARELVRQMNVIHEAQVVRVEHTAAVFGWVERLDARELADLAAAVKSLGNTGLYAPIRHLVGL